MSDILDLYEYAYSQGIAVECFNLPENISLSIMDEAGNCYIAIDPSRTQDNADELCRLAHEVGHCIKGSFYNRYARLDIKQKHENRADKWAITYLIPNERLKQAVSMGFTEPYELSEYFGVPQDFMMKAINYYQTQAVGAK